MKTLPAPTYKASRFHTTTIHFSGGICGKMWMPAIMAGKPHRQNARGTWGFYSKGDTFREALNHILMREGRDFQNALFTADSVLRIERRATLGNGSYTIHVWEREISSLPDCEDLVNADVFTGDVMGDCE